LRTHDAARPDLWNDIAEATEWAHVMSGAYAGMSARAAVGILFVHEQALFRGVVGNTVGHRDITLLRQRFEVYLNRRLQAAERHWRKLISYEVRY
jgi:hypothetical protein